MRLIKYIFLIVCISVVNNLWGQTGGYSIKFISSYSLNAVKFFDENTGIAVGDSGTILITKDSGLTWKRYKQITKLKLKSIFLINDSIGYIAGGDYNVSTKTEGIVLKSTDKGENWQINKIVQDESYNSISFLNESVGFVGGICSLQSDNYIPALKKTTDGGKSWYTVKVISDPNRIYIYSIKMVNDSIGYACGAPVALKTIDAGETWIKHSETGFPDYQFYDQYFFDENHGYLFGFSNAETSDGGSTWNIIFNKYAFISVKFLNTIDGIAVGQAGLLEKTTDSGQTWTSYSTGSYNSLYGIDFPDKNKGFAVGENGMLITFDFDSLSTNTVLSTLAFISPAEGEIVYNKYQFKIQVEKLNMANALLKLEYSLDDGMTWELINGQTSFNNNYYLWSTSNVDTSSQARFKITDLSSRISYISNKFKIIEESRKLFLRNPQEKDTLKTSENIKVTWDYDYSTNSNIGFEFIPATFQIFKSIPISQKNSIIELPPNQNHYQLKIFDIDNPQIYAVSDTLLIKCKPQLEIIKPSYKEISFIDSTQNISIAAYNVEYFKLECSFDSCKTWYILQDSIHADSNNIKVIDYNWKIPNTTSNECFIKAVSLDDSSVFNISNIFEITTEASYLNSFFPLEIGNYWQYKVWYDDPPEQNSNYDYMQVVKDTIINFTAYKVIKMLSFPYPPFGNAIKFLRYDTLPGSIMEYSIEDGKISTFFSLKNPTSEYYRTIFNENNHCKEYDNSSMLISYYLVNDFGLVQIFMGEGSKRLGYDLTYAKINGKEYGNFVSVLNDKNNIPLTYSLFRNYPNPFNPTTIFNYEIPKSGLVTINVYDVLGREIETLVNEEKNPGRYQVKFNGSNLASGLYFYRMTSNDFAATKKMLLMK